MMMAAAAGEAAPHNPGGSRDPTLQAAWAEAWKAGRARVDNDKTRAALGGESAALATSTRKQVARALEKPAAKVRTDLRPQEAVLTRTNGQALSDAVDRAPERAQTVLDEWIDEQDEEDEEFDLEELDTRLLATLDGNLGLALASAALAFGEAFADMSKETQQDQGAGTYIWLATKDSVTRPEHLALDGEEASWDDPPLSAEDASNGEPCHPGDDYNCRCVASPIGLNA